MIDRLPEIALALVGASTIFVVVLVARRIQLARRGGRRVALEQRMTPIALSLTAGDPEAVSAPATRGEAEALAAVLGRYVKVLSGEDREQIAEWFERQGIVGDLLDRLRHRRAWRRAAAAHLLGEIGAGRALPGLVAALADRDQDVRLTAARSLGRIGNPRAAPGLAEAIEKSTVTPLIGTQALLALGRDGLDGWLLLLAAREPVAREMGAVLVGALGSAGDERLVLALLEDESGEVRARACRTLGQLGAGPAAAKLRAMLGDSAPAVRGAAATALGAIGDREALQPLLRSARSDEFTPARYAARAAAQISLERTLAAAAAADAGPHLAEIADRAEAGLR